MLGFFVGRENSEMARRLRSGSTMRTKIGWLGFAIFSLLTVAVPVLEALDETSFETSFSSSGTVEEVGSMLGSGSVDWWVNSGGRMILGGTGKTVQGSLPSNDVWRLAYAAANPLDTDNGYHPQNIFRLVTRDRWKNFTQEASFRINRYNLSASPNRAEHNGILFFNRYVSGDTLYYAGIRVDGAAVIKRKKAGTYTTLAYAKVYPGTYDRTSMPNLLPVNRWIGLRSEIEDIPGGGVSIQLSLSDSTRGSGWMPILEAIDTGASGGAITTDGYAGIRTDFMDVEFDDYAAYPLSAPPPTATPTTPLPSPTPQPTPTAPPPTGSCSVSISPSTRTISSPAASGTISVSAPAGCAWTAMKDVSWIVLGAPASGIGNGAVSYQVQANSTGRKRNGTISVGGRTFQLTQRAG